MSLWQFFSWFGILFVLWEKENIIVSRNVTSFITARGRLAIAMFGCTSKPTAKTRHTSSEKSSKNLKKLSNEMC